MSGCSTAWRSTCDPAHPRAARTSFTPPRKLRVSEHERSSCVPPTGVHSTAAPSPWLQPRRIVAELQAKADQTRQILAVLPVDHQLNSRSCSIAVQGARGVRSRLWKLSLVPGHEKVPTGPTERRHPLPARPLPRRAIVLSSLPLSRRSLDGGSTGGGRKRNAPASPRQSSTQPFSLDALHLSGPSHIQASPSGNVLASARRRNEARREM